MSLLVESVWALELELGRYLPHDLMNFTKKSDFIKLVWYCADICVAVAVLRSGRTSMLRWC